jgi:hypothetical protein
MVVKKKEARRKKTAQVSSPKKLIARKPSKKTSKAQKFQLDVIARTNFNFCNGKKVAELLKENRRMWRAALMPLDLISLRDLEENSWHADRLYLYAEDGWQHSLEELVREQFNADEVHWIGGSSATNHLGTSDPGLQKKSSVILSVWWD